MIRTLLHHAPYVPDYRRPPQCMGGIGSRRSMLTARSLVITPVTDVITTSQTWNAPANFYGPTAFVECEGAGGGGGRGASSNAGGGGGGGAYAASDVAITPGAGYACVIGAVGVGSPVAATPATAGGSTTFDSTSVVAAGGKGGAQGTAGGGGAGGAGGAVVDSTGTTRTAGDNGLTVNSGQSGGNGAAPRGAVGGNAGNPSTAGTAPGGGGGGGRNSGGSAVGSNGGIGRMWITYEIAT